MRFDIISDTHGFLSDVLLRQLEGADVIVHAGDMCSEAHYKQLSEIAPLKMCLGNNDYGFSYGPQVKARTMFYAADMVWQLCHYRQRLNLMKSNVAVCGHTHRPFAIQDEWTGTWVINPGSPTYPRGPEGPTMCRVMAEEGRIVSAEIIRLSTVEGR